MENQDTFYIKPKIPSGYTCKSGKCKGNCMKKQALILQKMKQYTASDKQVGI